MLQLAQYLTVGEILAHLAPGSLVVGIAVLVLGINPAALTSALGVFLFLLISYLVGVLLDVLHRVLMDHPRLRRMPRRQELHKSLHRRAQEIVHGLEDKLGEDPSLLATAMVAHLRRGNEEIASYVGRQLEIGNLVVNAGVSLVLVGLIGLIGMPRLRQDFCRSTDAVAAMWADRAQNVDSGTLLFRYEDDYPAGDPCRRAAWIALREASMLPGLGPEGDWQSPDFEFVRFKPELPEDPWGNRRQTGPPYYDVTSYQLASMDEDELLRTLQKEFARISRCAYCRSAGVLGTHDRRRGRARRRAGWGRPRRNWLSHWALMPPGEETYYVFGSASRKTQPATAQPPAEGGGRIETPQRDPSYRGRYIVTVRMARFYDQCTAEDLTSPYAMRHLRVPGAEVLAKGLSDTEEALLRKAQDKLADGRYLGWGLLISLILGALCYAIGRRRVGAHLSYLAEEAFRYRSKEAPRELPFSDHQGET